MDVTEEFAVRYYRWAVLEVRQEMEAGFPLVSRLRNEHAETYLSIMNWIDDPSKRRLYLIASVKRFHPHAVSLLGEDMTRAEEKVLEWADALRLEMDCAMPARRLRTSSGKLKTLLRSELLTRFGRQTVLTRPGPKMLGLESRHGPWLVRTWFDCGRRSFYLHHIDTDEVKLASHLSIQSWMGISSMTEWTLGPANGEEELGPANSEEEIAITMVDASQRFLGRVSGLLEGLSP